MRAIGLFEAKTKFSELCERVASRGEPVVVTRRGKPLVRIEPCEASPAGGSVWDRREAFVREHGKVAEDFELAPREKQTWRDPLSGKRRARR